jgi:hypothetical protein
MDISKSVVPVRRAPAEAFFQKKLIDKKQQEQFPSSNERHHGGVPVYERTSFHPFHHGNLAQTNTEGEGTSS